MAKTYPITEEQKKFLESFRCERLKADPTNRWQIQKLYHEDGMGLLKKVKAVAWDEDHLGKTAYYVIKNASGQIVLLFSLKCGTLFNPNAVAEWAETCKNGSPEDIWRAVLEPDEIYRVQMAGLFRHSLPNMVERLQQRDPVANAQLGKLWHAIGLRRYREVVNMVDSFQRSEQDKISEPNQNIVLVPESYPAIELVEFCSNQATRDCWDKALMGKRRLGETLFWWFIAPKILEIGDAVGCEYVFLFAANNPDKDKEEAEAAEEEASEEKTLEEEAAEEASEEEASEEEASEEKERLNSLVTYYHSLHFRNDPELGTAKPDYDYECQFLCQPLRVGTRLPEIETPEAIIDYEFEGLDARQKQFFWNFNEVEEDVNAFDYL